MSRRARLLTVLLLLLVVAGVCGIFVGAETLITVFRAAQAAAAAAILLAASCRVAAHAADTRNAQGVQSCLAKVAPLPASSSPSVLLC